MLKIIFALLPLVSILLMIFVLKKSSIFTGIVACIITIGIAISPIFNTNIQFIPTPIIKSFFTTSLVVYILFFGILLFQLMEKSGAIKGIASYITSSTNDKVYQILLLALGLSPLIESVSGFGLAVIVIAPILIALEFSPIKSSLIALISLCIIPWGTLAMGTIIGATLGDIPLQKLGMGSALMCIPIYIYFSLLLIYIGAGKKALKEKLFLVICIGFLLGFSVWVCNRFVSVELAGLCGSLTVIAMIFLLVKLKTKKNKQTNEIDASKNLKLFIKNITPYLLLILLLFTSRIISPIKAYLSDTLTFSIEQYNFQLSLLYSPGFFLFLVCMFTLVLFRLNRVAIIDSIRLTAIKCYPVITTTFLYIAVSEIMTTASMVQILSSTAAQSFGQFFIFITPLIGATGGFLTGSNTASNTMFIRLQTETAIQIGASPLLIASAQNVSSSLMTMVNPSRVALSCSVCKISTVENSIQHKLAFIGLGTIAIILIELLIIYVLVLPT